MSNTIRIRAKRTGAVVNIPTPLDFLMSGKFVECEKQPDGCFLATSTNGYYCAFTPKRGGYEVIMLSMGSNDGIPNGVKFEPKRMVMFGTTGKLDFSSLFTPDTTED